jgi:hypothetical protein
MKKLLIYIGIASALLQGCTKDFDALNTDPTKTGASNYDPNYLLSSAQYAYSSQGYNYFMYQAFWSQTLASTSTLISSYLTNGDKYVATSGTSGYVVGIWNTDYGATDKFSTGAGNLVSEAINLTKADPTKANLTAVSTIMKVMIMEQVTDVYGDVPYSQAFQGKTGITQPVYDKQKDIYTAMFADLETAIGMLDASKALATGDMYYKGDVTQWKKFGYSLMLRMAMRLTKVDAATAKTWAEKAVAGGTFASIADNAIVTTQLSTSHDNAQARVYNVDLYETRWSKTMIDYLKLNADPRLGVVSEVPLAGLAENKLTNPGDKTPANQVGLPNGRDLGTTPATGVTNEPNYPGSTGTGDDLTPLGKYSRPTAAVYTNQNSPIFVFTYAETELLLAEAAVRGWNAGGTAVAHYANGVTAGMSSLATLGSALTVAPASISAYLLAHPLDVTTTDASLKQINTQFWATTGTMFNFMETWINWKRSGYPVLTPVNYNSNFSGGTIPRRQIYPASEATLNGANYKAASTSIGGDAWTSRVWWDVQ